MKDKKIVFMGTASFSKTVLLKLIENGFNVVAVVSQPDRLVGRKQVVTMPDVKVLALEHNIKVIQPNKIKEDYEEILSLDVDVLITAAYGQMIPNVVLEHANIAAINVHASMLPQYRGGAPVHRAIIDGNDKTGVTIMYMVKAMDAGNIISNCEVMIHKDEKASELYERLGFVGADLLVDTLPSIMRGENDSIVQEESCITYASVLKREDEHLSFDQDGFKVDCFVRGMNTWPGCFVLYKGKTVKVHEGHIHHCQNAVRHHSHQKNGTIVKVFKDGIGVKVQDGVYIITKLQLEGKKPVFVKDYLNGNNIFEVESLFE